MKKTTDYTEFVIRPEAGDISTETFGRPIAVKASWEIGFTSEGWGG